MNEQAPHKNHYFSNIISENNEAFSTSWQQFNNYVTVYMGSCLRNYSRTAISTFSLLRNRQPWKCSFSAWQNTYQLVLFQEWNGAHRFHLQSRARFHQRQIFNLVPIWDNRINVLRNYGVKYQGGINELYWKPKLLLIEFLTQGTGNVVPLHATANNSGDGSILSLGNK